MRKNGKVVVMISGIILMLVMLAGCSEQNVSTSTSADVGANVTQAVQDSQVPLEATSSSATEMASSEAEQSASQESSAVEETASSAEAATDNPYIIDGIDFTDYYAGKKSIKRYFLNDFHYDSLRWVVMYKDEIDSSIIGICKNGDSVKWEAKRNTYWYLYSPKKVVSFEKISELKEYAILIDDGEKGYWGGAVFEHKLTYDNEEMTVRFTYEDGTTEDITVYITAE